MAGFAASLKAYKLGRYDEPKIKSYIKDYRFNGFEKNKDIENESNEEIRNVRTVLNYDKIPFSKNIPDVPFNDKEIFIRMRISHAEHVNIMSYLPLFPMPVKVSPFIKFLIGTPVYSYESSFKIIEVLRQIDFALREKERVRKAEVALLEYYIALIKANCLTSSMIGKLEIFCNIKEGHTIDQFILTMKLDLERQILDEKRMRFLWKWVHSINIDKIDTSPFKKEEYYDYYHLETIALKEKWLKMTLDAINTIFTCSELSSREKTDALIVLIHIQTETYIEILETKIYKILDRCYVIPNGGGFCPFEKMKEFITKRHIEPGVVHPSEKKVSFWQDVSDKVKIALEIEHKLYFHIRSEGILSMKPSDFNLQYQLEGKTIYDPFKPKADEITVLLLCKQHLEMLDKKRDSIKEEETKEYIEKCKEMNENVKKMIELYSKYDDDRHPFSGEFLIVRYDPDSNVPIIAQIGEKYPELISKITIDMNRPIEEQGGTKKLKDVIEDISKQTMSIPESKDSCENDDNMIIDQDEPKSEMNIDG